MMNQFLLDSICETARYAGAGFAIGVFAKTSPALVAGAFAISMIANRAFQLFNTLTMSNLNTDEGRRELKQTNSHCSTINKIVTAVILQRMQLLRRGDALSLVALAIANHLVCVIQ